MARPEMLWRSGEWISGKLAAVDGRLRAIVEDPDNAPGLTQGEVLALIWRETDIPTVMNGPAPKSTDRVWVCAAEFLRPSEVFREGSAWMVKSHGRIEQIQRLIDLRSSDRAGIAAQLLDAQSHALSDSQVRMQIPEVPRWAGLELDAPGSAEMVGELLG